jgi:leader peptidase (prepilin peptidase)/N-methyltransferase
MQPAVDHLFALLDTSPALWICVVFVLSLLVGSFLNVVIHRVPIMLEREWRTQAEQIMSEQQTAAGGLPPALASAESRPGANTAGAEPRPYNLVVPRSACPKCGAMITATQNIPVISWLLLKGKCAKCGVRISARYPLVELLTAVLSALVAWKFGFTGYTCAALMLTWTLIALSGIDIDLQLLPDNITLPLVWLGLLVTLAGTGPGLGLPPDTRSSIIGAVAGYLSLWSVYHVFKLLTGKEGMGYGDFKLLAALGAWMGWQMLLPIILLSALAGSVVGIANIVIRGRDRDLPIPFGPYLAVAGWIALMWGDQLVGSYMRLSGMR